jgi:hypothetical protein
MDYDCNILTIIYITSMLVAVLLSWFAYFRTVKINREMQSEINSIKKNTEK